MNESRVLSLCPAFFDREIMMERIRRDTADAVFAAGLPTGRLKSLRHPDADLALSIRFKRSRWEYVCYDQREVRTRQVEGLILVGGAHVGSFAIVELDIPLLTGRWSFFDQMDSRSSADYQLAETLLAHWIDPAEVSDVGNIVELRRLWMAQTAALKPWLRKALELVLQDIFGDRSLLILKAFPLEYEGSVSADNKIRFLARQRAMMRFYSTTIGVQPLPGESGGAGWMYAIPEGMRNYVDEPRVEPIAEH